MARVVVACEATVTRGGAVTLVAIAIGVAAVAALLLVIRDEPRIASPIASASTPTAVVVPAPAVPPAFSPSSSAKPIVVAVVDAFDPEIDDSWKLLKPGDPPQPGDPFEDPEAGVQMAKLLARVGRIRVGYLHKGAAIKDEAAVTNILKRVGLEVDELDRHRQDQPHKRVAEYEKVFAKYRDELKPYMQGSAMIAGLGWSLAFVVDPDAG
jgi:hypothetical protein